MPIVKGCNNCMNSYTRTNPQCKGCTYNHGSKDNWRFIGDTFKIANMPNLTCRTKPDPHNPGKLMYKSVPQCVTCHYLPMPRGTAPKCNDCRGNSNYKAMGDYMLACAVEALNSEGTPESLKAQAAALKTPPLSEMDNLARTLTDREDAYGDYTTKCRTIWGMKHKLHATPNWEALPVDMKESLHMIVHKISRILHGQPDHIDSWHDIQGYAKLIEQRLNKEYRDGK